MARPMCWLVICLALGAGVLASGRGSAQVAPASEAGSGARADGAAVLGRKLDTRVAKFDTGGRTLLQCVVDLAFQYKLPGAIEYAGGGGATRKLELKFEDETVRSLLEKLVEQNAGYRVDFSGGIVDVFSPRARQDAENPFNDVIRDFLALRMRILTRRMRMFCVRWAVRRAGRAALQAWPSVNGRT